MMTADNRQKRRVEVSSWDQVSQEELRILHEILEVKRPDAVEAAACFARYLRRQGLDSENYPLFLRMLDIENHWVLDALIGDDDPLTLFASIPPNRFLVERAVRMLSKWPLGGVYPKALGVLLGILHDAYMDPRSGHKIYPLTTTDIVNLGKHLDPESGLNHRFNIHLLEMLEKISDFEGERRESPEWDVARQAGKIRSIFFDNRKTMDMVIPVSLTIRDDYRKSEVRPAKLYVD